MRWEYLYTASLCRKHQARGTVFPTGILALSLLYDTRVLRRGRQPRIDAQSLLPQFVLLRRQDSGLVKQLLELWQIYPDPTINELAQLLQIALFGVYIKHHRSQIMYVIAFMIALVWLLVKLF